MTNWSLVDEILEFVKNGPLLVGSALLDFEEVVVETNFEAALDHAHVQYLWDAEGNLRDDHDSWADVRETEISNVYEASFESEDLKELKPRIHELQKTASTLVEERLAEHFSEATEDIASDMELLIEVRALVGCDNAFFETLFRWYRLGVWPCGWQGRYPVGKLRVFNPQES
ncbi:hypothetical protein [Armatimonas sp.]|uniref:hypothetical protein n=1 Tax=Armatimonas sp. TaxID=1872638 RepID=UPI00374D9B08